MSSRAWFVLATAAVLGLFYVGHGLHENGDPSALPTSMAFGQEPAKAVFRWRDLDRALWLGGDSYRAKVPGGWLVLVRALQRDGNSTPGGLTFVPDPEHTWDGSTLQ
jgi:hypothetical protein